MSSYAIQMPDGVEVEELTEKSGRFVIQPLERGYGVTIGNALRRVLLSSLDGVAITAIKIDGVSVGTEEGVLNISTAAMTNGQKGCEAVENELTFSKDGEYAIYSVDLAPFGLVGKYLYIQINYSRK